MSDLFEFVQMLGIIGLLAFTWMTLRRVEEVEHHTNSKMDQLLEEVRVSSLARGRLQQREETERRDTAAHDQ